MQLISGKMVKDDSEIQLQEKFTDSLVEWLDFVRGETNEFQFEKEIGLVRNSIRNMREGKVPETEKLVCIKLKTGISWDSLGTLLEESFTQETDENLIN